MCQVYKEAKYSTSYWPKELYLEMFKGTQDKDNKQDRYYYRKDIYKNNIIENPKK